SEGEKKRRDLPLARRDGEGMSRSPAFASSDRPFASHSPEIARLDELFAPSEAGGTRPEREGMRPERRGMPCTSGLAEQNLRGMPRELRGTGRDEELPWLNPCKTSQESQKRSSNILVLQSFSPILGEPAALQGHRAGEEFPARGLTSRIV